MGPPSDVGAICAISEDTTIKIGQNSYKLSSLLDKSIMKANQTHRPAGVDNILAASPMHVSPMQPREQVYSKTQRHHMHKAVSPMSQRFSKQYKRGHRCSDQSLSQILNQAGGAVHRKG